MTETKIKLFNGEFGILKENDKMKAFKAEGYNFLFFKESGSFYRWGTSETKKPTLKADKSLSDFKEKFILFMTWKEIWGRGSIEPKQFFRDMETDGDMTLGLPEILDLEISEVCDGVPGIGPCKFCYKSNTGFKGDQMSFETFKQVFHKLPPTITQIAFGCGTLRKHVEMWDMFRYAKTNGVAPNLTINGDVDKRELDMIAELCGAVAVSVYDKELSYNAVKELTDRGMTQVNIHYMISEETYEGALEVMNDRLTDPRLAKLNAIVLLSLKTKGRAYGKFNQLSQDKFDNLFKFALDNNIGVGFDSCSAQKAFKFMNKDDQLAHLESMIEPCESSVYSSYINVKGEYYPCSFSEGDEGWDEGIDVLTIDNFLEDIWFKGKTKEFSDEVINCRTCSKACPIYEI